MLYLHQNFVTNVNKTVTAGTTYVIFPYLYNYTSEFSFTLKNFVFTCDINIADGYEYTTDESLDYPDAKGFTADFTVDDGKTVNSLTWYISKDSTNYKKLTSGNLPEIASGNIRVGLILYDLPEGISADEISAGYSYTSTTIE